jgi:hypothetical protein
MVRSSDRQFTSPMGRPLNPNSDYHRWKALLKSAGVRDARLHDARHTAATVLLVLGVPERSVMGIMGWSSTAMAARYQHVTDPIRRTIAAQVGRLLWAAEKGSPNAIETETETTALLIEMAAAPLTGVVPGQVSGGCGIRTREGLHPTRFPSLPAAGQSMFRPHREATITGMATDHELR